MDILTAAHALQNDALTGAASLLALHAGCALFSHCYMAPLLTILQKTVPDLPLIYDSHNVEAALQAILLADHPAAAAVIDYVTALEHRLLTTAAVVFCCSPADAAMFAPLARQIVELPHGMQPHPTRIAAAGPARIGFLGSDHPPNIAAARLIVDRLAPNFPQLIFDIVGSVCQTLGSDLPANVVLHGIVSETQKHALLGEWRVALNPITEGGGASVKLADYLAHGLPSLNTAYGARGTPIVESGAGRIADIADFSAMLATMLHDAAGLHAMAIAAAALGQDRDWPVVAAKARQAISALMARPQQNGNTRSGRVAVGQTRQIC